MSKAKTHDVGCTFTMTHSETKVSKKYRIVEDLGTNANGVCRRAECVDDPSDQIRITFPWATVKN